MRYLQIAAPPLLFLMASGLSLLVSLDFGSSTHGISLHLAEAEFFHIAHASSRSLACLTALLFLALTTPLTDIIALLRRCKLPETLLDLMTLCYRTLFVLSEAVHETITAQSARLGYMTLTISLRSLGVLVSNLMVQVWQRSLALHTAAQSRNNDGALRFLGSRYDNSRRNISIALLSGTLMIAASLKLP
jgi:cobalt/nickel transport system permease protein